MAKKPKWGGSSTKDRNWDVEEWGTNVEDNEAAREDTNSRPFLQPHRTASRDEALSDVRARNRKGGY